MAQFQRPRGTRDFTPEEMKIRRWVENTMRKIISSFGYLEIATPTFENADLFIERSGEQVLEQIYSFEDKGGRSIALRPELTAPVMRFYYSDMRNRPKPLRISYFGNCFRYERPQKGRYREFWQMGLEYIGKRSPLALAEVIEVAIESLDAVGLKDYQVRVGHVSLLASILRSYGVDPKRDKELMISIDKKDIEGITKYLKNIIGKDPEGLIGLVTSTYGKNDYVKVLDELNGGSEDIKKDVDELREVLGILFNSNAEIDLRMDPSISRGLDYYDGVVFEIDAPGLGAEKQICGGGAYCLTEVFGGDVQGIGFGLGFDRIIVALGEIEAADERERPTYIMPMGDGADAFAFKIASNLRRAGLNCIIETAGRNLKKAISYATSMGCRYLILIGSDEIEKGIVSVKDLDTKKQTGIRPDDLLDHLI